MSTMSHPPAGLAPERRHWSVQILVAEMWAAVAIVAMWIAVAVSAVWGPDFVASDGGGTNTTTIPSGIAVAVFAAIGTWAVARHGFGHRREDTD